MQVQFIYSVQYHKSYIFLEGLYNLYSIPLHPSLDPPFGEKLPKTLLTGRKKVKVRNKFYEEQQRRNFSSRTDRHAIDVMCTEKKNDSMDKIATCRG